MQRTIFRDKPKRKTNFKGLKNYGYIKLNAEYSLIQLKLNSNNKKNTKEIIKKIEKILKEYGFYTINLYYYHRNHNHCKSYLGVKKERKRCNKK